MYLKFKVGPCISGSGLKKLVLPQMYAYSANFRSTGIHGWYGIGKQWVVSALAHRSMVESLAPERCEVLPSKKLTSPTLGKGKVIFKNALVKGYVSSLEGQFQGRVLFIDILGWFFGILRNSI